MVFKDKTLNPYYQENEITIYHADCFEALATLTDKCVDVLVTDPPYFQPAVHYVPSRTEDRPRRSLADTSILQHFFSDFALAAVRVLKDTASIYIFCDGQSYPILFNAFYPLVKKVRPLVWDKTQSMNGYTWRHQHELIAWAEMENAPRIATGDGDVLRCEAVPVAERLHPAQKPINLLLKLLEKTPVGAVVLDPFCGSGTTAAAAFRSGRGFIGAELDKNYCDIAKGRLREGSGPCLLGQQALGFAVA